jgi:hypothetical protein
MLNINYSIGNIYMEPYCLKFIYLFIKSSSESEASKKENGIVDKKNI